MTNKRVHELTENTAPEAGDYLLIDRAGDASAGKVNVNKFVLAGIGGGGINRIQDATDFGSTPGAGNDGYAIAWDNDAGEFVLAAAAGGVSDHGALDGLSDDDHTQYLLATGARTGASSQAQTFTSGIIGPTWKPSADSTTALQLQQADGTAVLTVDTTNRRIGVGKTPNALLDLVGSIQTNPIASFLNKNDNANWAPIRFGQAMADGSNEFGLNIGSYNASGNKIMRWQLYGSPTEWSFDTGADDLFSFTSRFIAKAGLMGAFHTDLDIVLNQHTNGGADKGIKFKIAGGGTTAAVIMETGLVGIGTDAPASRLDIDAGALTIKEMTAPDAPAANSVVIYAVDNGGKTELCARFPSGAVQQLAIEP